jgi:hypothetical protein
MLIVMLFLSPSKPLIVNRAATVHQKERKIDLDDSAVFFVGGAAASGIIIVQATAKLSFAALRKPEGQIATSFTAWSGTAKII